MLNVEFMSLSYIQHSGQVVVQPIGVGVEGGPSRVFGLSYCDFKCYFFPDDEVSLLFETLE